MSTLQNKKVIVIGGSSGIGKAVATLAHQSDALVTITSRSLLNAKTVATSMGEGIQAAALDINDPVQVDNFFASFTAIDHIYIAAGSTYLGNLLEGDLSDHMHSFQERLLGSLRIVKAAIPRMQTGSSITFTGGVSTDRPIAGAWVSGLGTASAEQLARVLVMEFPTIRFNAVSPGYTDTPLWDRIMGDNKQTVLAGIAGSLPVKKIASAEEVASAVIFLMLNASVTGEVIHVDGGARLI